MAAAKKISDNIIASALCIEWLEMLFKPDRFGNAAINLNHISDSGVKEALNQIRKGIGNYKRAMLAHKKLADSEFSELQDFAAYKIEILTELAQAFIPLDEEGCEFLVQKLHDAVVELRESKE